jgi:catechol 2,3-dioxygenase-like lactoylglutathione lyase family enzyme
MVTVAVLCLTVGRSTKAAVSFDEPRAGAAIVALSSVALRVHNMDRMVAFYTEAFGGRFHEVDARGIRSQFGQVGGFTMKLVPIRDAADFKNFPILQLGFTVDDIQAVIAVAVKHGGRQEGQTIKDGERLHAAIRDPDGNTIELYQTIK